MLSLGCGMISFIFFSIFFFGLPVFSDFSAMNIYDKTFFKAIIKINTDTSKKLLFWKCYWSHVKKLTSIRGYYDFFCFRKWHCVESWSGRWFSFCLKSKDRPCPYFTGKKEFPSRYKPFSSIYSTHTEHPSGLFPCHWMKCQHVHEKCWYPDLNVLFNSKIHELKFLMRVFQNWTIVRYCLFDIEFSFLTTCQTTNFALV